MAGQSYQPVKDAMNRIKQLSADEETRRLAFVRERALHDEATLLKEAKEQGLQQGREETKRETASKLIQLGMLNDTQIAETTGLVETDVQALRAEAEH